MTGLTVEDLSKTPDFPDETRLQATGQYGPQRFRKSLLYPAELRIVLLPEVGEPANYHFRNRVTSVFTQCGPMTVTALSWNLFGTFLRDPPIPLAASEEECLNFSTNCMVGAQGLEPWTR